MSLCAKENASICPRELALTDGRWTLDWAELDPLVNRLTNALISAQDTLPGGRAAIFAPNCTETALAYLGTLHAGVSSVPVNYHFTVAEVAYILENSGSTILFVGPETLEVGLDAARQVGVSTVIGWRCPVTPGVMAWDEWIAAASEAEPPTDMPPQPHLHYTSGTTGRPKGTETPPNTLPRLKTVSDLIDFLKERQQTMGNVAPYLLVSPIYHTGPLGSIRALAGGTSVVILPRFDAEEVLEAVERHQVKSTLMVPTHFQRLLALPDKVRIKYDVTSLTSVNHTGAACPMEVKRQMIAWFGPVLNEAYGATEAGTTNFITSEEWLRKPGSVGLTQPPYELLVIDDDGKRLGVGDRGALYFRDTTGRGIVYHNDQEKTAAAHIEPGVFTLGEIGYVDEDGYVFITDRMSDMIVSGGVNIYPAETEKVLLAHPFVADAAVIGVPNADMGEEVKALVIIKRNGAVVSEAELQAYCRGELAGYKCPRSVDFVDDLGRNAMGKINKRELRRKFWPSERTIGG